MDSALFIIVQCNRRRESQRQNWSAENCAIFSDLNFVRIAGIVKGGPAIYLKRQRSSHHVNCANKMVLSVPGSWLYNGHEIGDLTDPIMRKKARDENIGLWKIHLLRFDAILLGGSQAKKSSPLS